jgi:hypothetical protein
VTNEIRSIPRPLVRTNQWFIVLSVLAAWTTGYEWLLLLPLVAGLLGLIFKFNPVIKGAAYFLRKKPKEYIPEEWEQQQFNQFIAVICLIISLISFAMNWTILAYVFSAMVGLAAFVAILGFCIGCFIRFQWQQLLFRRAQNR